MDHGRRLVVGARRLALGWGIVLLASSAAHGQQVDLVSRAATPADSAGGSVLAPTYTASASDDGRYSLFLSSAPNVVPGQVDINTGNDAFVYDRVTGTTVLASHGPGSSVTTGIMGVSDAVISADGAYVAFLSSQIFLFERATGVLRAVPGSYPNNGSLMVSADGRFVSFVKWGGLQTVAIYDRTTDATTDLAAGYDAQLSADGSFVVYAGWPNCHLHERATGTVTLVDHAAGLPTTPGDGGCSIGGISGDGAYVAFYSGSTNLVAGQVDTPGTGDVFVFERASGEIRLVSHAAGSAVTAIENAGRTSLSRDGRYVAFESQAANLVPGQVDANGGSDLFLYDRSTTTNILVSHAASSLTTAANAASGYATISADGAYVAFVSAATNLMASQSDGPYGNDAFLFERATGTIALVTHALGQPAAATDVPGNLVCAIAGGGGFVLFASPARTLVDAIYANVEADVFSFERASGLNQLVSRSGRPSVTANAPSQIRLDATEGNVRMSADGRYTVFTSEATNLVPGQVDANGGVDVFLFDRGLGQTTLISHASGSSTTAANGPAYPYPSVAISADGRFVIFLSSATNLVPAQVDTNGNPDLFLFERATGEVTLVSHLPGFPATAEGPTGVSAISDDGSYVAFRTYYSGIRLYDRQTGDLSLVSAGSDASTQLVLSGDGRFVAFTVGPTTSLYDRVSSTTTPVAIGSYPRSLALSADGRFLAFLSEAPDLVPGQVDAAGTTDAFLYDRVATTISLVSHTLGSAVTAAGASDTSSSLSVNADGSYVAFESASTGLVAGQVDTAGTSDIFLYARATGLITLVSHAAGLPTTTAAGASTDPVISADGSVVALASYGTNLVSAQNGPPNTLNVFLFERATGTLTLASPTATGATANGRSQDVRLSRSGSHVVFASDATDLVAEDFNQKTDVFVFGACSASPVITLQPGNQVVPIGGRATFQVLAQNAGSHQWQKDGVDIPDATALYYTTPPVTAADSGTTYRAVVRGACASQTISRTATLTIGDAQPPMASVLSPSGGEYWLLSPAGGPARQEIVSWSMSDDVRVCQASVSLRYSSDGGSTYLPAPTGGGLPATFGTGRSCPYPGTTTTNLAYTVPSVFPSGTSGSLYKVRVVVTDQAGNTTTVESPNPFYIVQANPDNVRTLVLSNVPRMQAKQGLTPAEASALTGKLLELAGHPRVQGVVVDLGTVTALSPLYAAYDAAVAANDGTSPLRANDVLFAASGVHDYLRSLLAVYSGVRYLVLVGDDRVIPFARMPDGTVLLRESAYPASADLRAGATGVGQALAANSYLSDDPLAVRDPLRPADLSGSVFVPDLEIGRLVETAPEITTAIATFIGQNGGVDLSALDAVTGHKALVTGYDFLTDGAKRVRARWKAVFVESADSSLAPVDGSLVAGNWGLGTAAARAAALRARLSGNGGAPYGVVSLSGHAAHYLEGVPGNDFTDVQGLFTSDIYGADACGTPSLGALNLAGSVVYAAGCHGGLAVPGSCRTDADHSLDLPQTFLARGVQGYVANTGYGWGLKYGVGYGERLSELMTEELTSAATVPVGEAVRRTKLRYFLESPRYDPYDQKTLMQWTLYGLPMYAVKTGLGAPAGVAAVDPLAGASEDRPADASVDRPVGPSADRLAGSSANRLVDEAGTVADRLSPIRPAEGVGVRRSLLAAQPPYLTQLNLSFDFTAAGLHKKRNSLGDEIAGTGCPDPNGCYYTLNGLATGSTDLPLQPYFVYDSRLSGTSQHGVLWKGGTYDEETGWKPVFSELVSTVGGADASNHGDAPRLIIIRATAPRLVPGQDPAGCRPADLEVNSVVSPTGEALKAQDADPTYTIERRYRTVDLEAFYFASAVDPAANCDRDGPEIGAGPFAGGYHQVSGRAVRWSVPATDPSGVWRVVIVSNDNTVDANGRGRWVPLDLAYNPATLRWEGTRSDLSGDSTRLTYVVQAIDTRGNAGWVDYVSAGLPASGTGLGLPLPVDVPVSPGTTVTGFAPASAPVGATVTVGGTQFVGVTLVTFGGVPAIFTPVSSTQLTAVVPVGAASGPIEVTAALGKGTSPTAFVVVAPPTVTGLHPADGPVGTLVRIAGTHLSGATAVTFNAAAAVFAVLSPAQIEAAVPPGATTGPVAVTTPFGTAQSPSSFTVTGTGGGTGFHTVSPCRAADTRNDPPALAAGATRVFPMAGRCDIPATARAVSLNVTVTGPTSTGNLRLYPADAPTPTSSAINYTAGQTRANNVIIALSPSGEIAVKCAQASGAVDVVLDVNGYFE